MRLVKRERESVAVILGVGIAKPVRLLVASWNLVVLRALPIPHTNELKLPSHRTIATKLWYTYKILSVITANKTTRKKQKNYEKIKIRNKGSPSRDQLVKNEIHTCTRLISRV